MPNPVFQRVKGGRFRTMSANLEFQLLCKIIETQDFHTVEKLKIDETFFLGDPNIPSQTREVFRFIRDHYHNETTYGAVPSWDILQQRFYGFPWHPSYDTLPTLCQEVRRSKVRAQIFGLADDLNRIADVDPFQALNTVKEAASRFSSQHELSSDLLLSNAHEVLLQEYEMVQSGKGLLGLPFPWDVLNEDTQGMQEQNFIIIYGRPGMMKSWIALYIAVNAYMHGSRVLIYSMEMSPQQVMRRCACIIAKVDYERFKKAQLDPGTMQRVFDILMYLEQEEKNRTNALGHQAAMLASQPDNEGGGIASLHAKIREFDPDLVVVDGMYLMKDDRQKTRTVDWKAISHISQDLKGTARVFKIPVIGVTQANRQANKDPTKADLVELSYADALAQDCDLCLRVHKQIDSTTKETELVLSFPKIREGTLDHFVVHGVPAINFSYKRATATDPNAPPATTPPSGNSGGSGGGGGRGQQRTVPVLPCNWRAP